jgi:pantetheine-phosphate adenylyltransferase
MADKKVIIGGTFEFLHKGHKALLVKAFSLGDVRVGLTSDEMVKKMKPRQVRAFFEREKTLTDFINNELGKEANIIKINDIFGPALEEDFDYMVVSPETEEGAIVVNNERKKRGKNPIEIIKIDWVLAKDGKFISSTRIAEGDIDKEGNLLKK